MSKIKLYDDRGILTLEAMKILSDSGSGVSCECPTHLVGLLEKAKAFTEYQENCLIEKPADRIMHEWLKSNAVTLEHFISSTIVSLARMEGIINDKDEIN